MMFLFGRLVLPVVLESVAVHAATMELFAIVANCKSGLLQADSEQTWSQNKAAHPIRN
jgi:hypothetical protein